MARYLLLHAPTTLLQDLQSIDSPVFGVDKSTKGSRGKRGLYLAGAAVQKEHQHVGLYRKMNHTRIGKSIDARLSFIFTRTQNPKIEKGIVATLDAFQAEGRIAGFTIAREIVRGAYGRMLTERKPEPHYEDLNYKAGDAHLFVFRLTYP